MKKLISLILALVMVMGLAVTAFADNEGEGGATPPAAPTTGSITITPPALNDGIEAGITYKAYKIFDATLAGDITSVPGKETDTTTPVSYTISDSTLKEKLAKFPSTEAPAFEFEQIGETTWNVVKKADYDAAALAAYLKDSLSGGTSATYDQINNKYKFEGLSLGYYLITSSVGSNIIVDTLGNVNVEAKNAYPSLTKVIVEDDADVTEVMANYGDTITFKLTVTIPESVNGDIIIHDTMDTQYEDLIDATLTSTSGVVKLESCEVEGCAANVHFKVSEGAQKNENHEFSFNYTAKLTAGAEVALAHENVAHLTYSTFTSKETDPVKVYTYAFVLKKVDQKGQPLPNATFQLPFYVQEVDGVYNYAGTETDDGLVNTVTTPDNGVILIKGVVADNYQVTETEAPAGYNKLTAPVSVSVSAQALKDQETTDFTTYLDANGNVSEAQTNTTVNYENEELAATVAVVVNKTGSELPSTGGIGTTLFYVIGGLLMAGAAVLLITKKRMA